MADTPGQLLVRPFQDNPYSAIPIEKHPAKFQQKVVDVWIFWHVTWYFS